MRSLLVTMALATILWCAMGLGCMSTGYRSETFHENGQLKSRRHVYNATVWHDAVKDTFSTAWEFVQTSPLTQVALGAVGLGAIGAPLAVRGKRKSYNKGLEIGAKIKGHP